VTSETHVYVSELATGEARKSAARSRTAVKVASHVSRGHVPPRAHEVSAAHTLCLETNSIFEGSRSHSRHSTSVATRRGVAAILFAWHLRPRLPWRPEAEKGERTWEGCHRRLRKHTSTVRRPLQLVLRLCLHRGFSRAQFPPACMIDDEDPEPETKHTEFKQRLS
jgi:hypothetical protein